MQDNCGVFGICADTNILTDLFVGTFYLQHRGQQYGGLATFDGREMKIRTRKGLLRQGFADDLGGLDGYMGIGHVSLHVRQPIRLDARMGEFCCCFSGNINNLDAIIKDFKSKGHSFATADEIEVMGKLIASGKNIADGIERATETIDGSFSLLVLTPQGLYGVRSPKGHSPLVIGRRENAIAIASESCAFNNLGFNIVRDVKPGEIVFVRSEIRLVGPERIETLKQMSVNQVQYCTFEWVYTANPASTIEGQCVDVVRQRIGASLARRYPVKADLVAAVPNSGIGHAIGYAQESGIPYDRVFLRYDYADRSYTQFTQEIREREAKIKLIPIAPKIKGKRVILLDDSIVRGTQMKMDMAAKLRAAGVKELHARIACPPLMAPCRYGRSTRGKEELLAGRMPVEQIASYLGLDGLGYNTIDDLVAAVGLHKEQLCLSCWTGRYF